MQYNVISIVWASCGSCTISSYLVFYMYVILDLFTASKDKSLQAVDMNTGGVAHAINKAHK